MIQSGIVTIMVSDMSRSVNFYTKTLGLELKVQHDDEWAEVEAPGVRIGLHGGKKDSGSGGGANLSIGFQVESIEDAMSTLTDRKVAFPRGISDDGAVRLAFFSDPDDTALYLCQEKKSS